MRRDFSLAARLWCRAGESQTKHDNQTRRLSTPAIWPGKWGPFTKSIWLALNQPLFDGLSIMRTFPLGLEHFHKCCSNAEAVFLALGCVSARSQAAAGMLPRQNCAPRPKIFAPHRHIISLNALGLQ